MSNNCEQETAKTWSPISCLRTFLSLLRWQNHRSKSCEECQECTERTCVACDEVESKARKSLAAWSSVERRVQTHGSSGVLKRTGQLVGCFGVLACWIPLYIGSSNSGVSTHHRILRPNPAECTISGRIAAATSGQSEGGRATGRAGAPGDKLQFWLRLCIRRSSS